MERMHGTVTPKNIDSLFLLTGDAAEGGREGEREGCSYNKPSSTSTIVARESLRLPRGDCLSCTEQLDRSLHARLSHIEYWSVMH